MRFPKRSKIVELPLPAEPDESGIFHFLDMLFPIVAVMDQHHPLLEAVGQCGKFLKGSVDSSGEKLTVVKYRLEFKQAVERCEQFGIETGIARVHDPVIYDDARTPERICPALRPFRDMLCSE